MKENKFLQPRTLLKQKLILVLFGLFLFFVLLEVSLRLGGSVLLSMQEYRNRQASRQKGAYRIMCLGESTTFCGESGHFYCLNIENAYPHKLEGILNQAGLAIKFCVVNLGVPGVNSAYIAAHLEENLNLYKPDMVIAMMGINDGEDHLLYEEMRASKKGPAFKSFRTYKLVKLLWLHVKKKAEETGFLKWKRDQQLRGQLGLSRGVSNAGKINAEQTNSFLREKAYKKAVEMNPDNDTAYGELGWFYEGENRHAEAAAAFKKAIEINPKNICAYTMLGGFYEHQGAYSDAEELFKKAIAINPQSDALHAALGILYQEIGQYQLAEVFRKKSEALRLKKTNLFTLANYLDIKKILDHQGVKLVCVQYPMRSVELLKKMFEDDAGVTFVDNEKVFKDAIDKGKPSDYFADMFAGDFGHCTEKGNSLLAENIADTIIKEVFGK